MCKSPDVQTSKCDESWVAPALETRHDILNLQFDTAPSHVVVAHRIVRRCCDSVHEPTTRKPFLTNAHWTCSAFRFHFEICALPSSGVADAVSFFNTSKRLSNSLVYTSFLPRFPCFREQQLDPRNLTGKFQCHSRWPPLHPGSRFPLACPQTEPHQARPSPPSFAPADLSHAALKWWTLRVFEFTKSLSRVPTVKQVEPLLSATAKHGGVQPRTHVQVAPVSSLVSTPKFCSTL